MVHRWNPFGLVVAVAIGMAPFAMLPSTPLAFQADDESIGQYVSPHYGYTLSFDTDVWSIAYGDELPSDRFDRVYLAIGPSLISFTSHPDYQTPQLDECQINFELGIRAAPAVSGVVLLEEPGAAGKDGERAWQTVTYLLEQADGSSVTIASYIECRWLGDGLTMVIRHDAALDDYPGEVLVRESLVAGLELPPVFGSKAVAAEKSASRSVEQAEYESPHYGFTITYDPNIWGIGAEDDDPSDAYDRIEFSSTPNLIIVWGDPDYADGEMAACVAGYVDPLAESPNIVNFQNMNGPEASGEDETKAWTTITYTWEFREGAEADFVQYYECIWLGDDVTVVVLHEVIDVSYEFEIGTRTTFLAGLQPPKD